jgi:hypothetical protein
MKIVVTQFYTPNVDYAKFSRQVNEKYCQDNGYIYYAQTDEGIIKEKIEGRSWTWYKPHLLKEVLDNHPDCDYILFIDIDAVLCDSSRKIEEFIENDIDLLMTQDHGDCLVNAGVMLFKPTDATKKFLDDWWEICERHPQYKTGIWHDQTCIGLLMEEMQSPSWFKVIQNSDLNSRVYNKRCFIFHAFAFGHVAFRTLDVVCDEILNPKSTEEKTLSDIAKDFPTDKDFEHNYFSLVYEEYLSPIRETVTSVCEIGTGGFWGEIGWEPGNSLKVWEAYFPNAQVRGLDIAEYDLKDTGRISLEWIDQSQRDVLDKYADSMEEQDLILDDGSHKMKDQQITLASFFKKLKSGGVYILEDLHTSNEAGVPEKGIWPWGSCDPDKTKTLDMLKELEKTGNIVSDYITEKEDIEYLQDNIKSVEIFSLNKGASITSVITKK